MELGNAHGKVTLDASGVSAGVDSAANSLKSLQLAGEKMGQAMVKGGQLLTLGLTVPITAFGVKSVSAAMESSHAMAELNAVIASTKGVAGVSAKAVTDYATAMQKVTKFDDEAIIAGQSMLLTFTKIGKDVFPQASTAVLNMAEKFGSVDQAAIQLGKALNDPVAGVGALRRVGVALSTQQEKQIKDFMKVNNIAGAQKIILKELETEFGGLAVAAGATPEGKYIQFQNALGDLQETVGNILLPSLLKLLDVLKWLIEQFQAAPVWVQQLSVAFGIFLAALGPILIGLGSLMQFVSAVSVAWPMITAAVAAAGPVFATIGTIISGTVIPAIVAFAVAAAPIILTIGLVVAAVALLYYAFKNNFGGITDTVKMLGVIIPVLIGQMWEKVKQFFADAWKSLTDYANNIRNSIVEAFTIDWGQVGRNIIEGILNGIVSWIEPLVAAARNAAQSVLDAMRTVFDSHSPSMKTFMLGQDVVQGFVNGTLAALHKMVAAAQLVGQTWLKMNAGFTAQAARSAMTTATTALESWIKMQITLENQSINASKRWAESQLKLKAQYLAQMALLEAYYAARASTMFPKNPPAVPNNPHKPKRKDHFDNESLPTSPTYTNIYNVSGGLTITEVKKLISESEKQSWNRTKSIFGV